MISFNDYCEYRDLEAILEHTAVLIVEKELPIEAFEELADIYLEVNPLGIAGGMAGSMIGGVPGAMAGSMVGQKAGQAVGNWFKKGMAPQVTPAYQQAKQAVANLVNNLSSAGQNQPQLQNLIQYATKIQNAVHGMEKQLPQVDQHLKQQFAASGQGGGLRGKLGAAGQKISNWAQKHPNISKGLGIGAAMGAGALMNNYGNFGGGDTTNVGSGDGTTDAGRNWFSGDGEANVPTQPAPGHYNTSQATVDDDGNIYSRTPSPDEQNAIDYNKLRDNRFQKAHQRIFNWGSGAKR